MKRIATPLRRLLVDREGEALLSTALCMGIMLGFVFGVMQVGLAYYSKERISEMAREGARYAILHGSTCTVTGGTSCTATAAQVQTYTQGLGYPNLGAGTVSCPVSFWTNTTGTVATTSPTNAPNNYVNVACTYTFPYKIPFVTTTPLTLSSSSTMLILM